MIKVSGSGPSQAKIMIVGEAPGMTEERYKLPFHPDGEAGRILRQCMMQVGIKPEDTYITNVCKYRPPHNELAAWFDKKTGIPNATVIEGLMELKDEIAAVKPNVIVALGNYALWALSGKAKWNHRTNSETGQASGYSGIGDWRGSIIEGNDTTNGTKIVCSYHPAAVARKWPWNVYLQADLKRAREQSAYPELRRPAYRIDVSPQGEDRMEWQRTLLSGELVAADIEFIGKELLCMSFSNSADATVVIPAKSAEDLRFIRSICESGVPLCMQNGMFDCSILEYWYRIRAFQNLKFDTMLASHAAYVELPKDLGTLCSIYTEQPCYWTNIDWKKIRSGQQPVSDVYAYNGIDSWVTKQIATQQEKDELRDPAYRAAFEFEMQLLVPLWEIAKRGVRVNQAKWAELRRSVDDEIARRTEFLAQASQSPAFNVASPKQVGDLLYTRLGLRVTKSNKQGPATDDKTLAALDLATTDTFAKHVVSEIRATRKARSLKSKFIEIELDHDHRYRSHYNPAGTNTWRLASKKFFPTGKGGNGQNIPRDSRIRELFIPDDGYYFFYFDLERAESMVVAELSGDALMLAHHQPGVDAHRKLAAEVLFHKPEEEVTKTERYLGKQTRHAGNYMQGWMTFMNNVNKFAEETGIFLEAKQAKEYVGKYREAHIMLQPWWNSIEQELREKRYLTNLFGFKRVFHDRLSNNLPEAVAFKPQSTVGVALSKGLLNLHHHPETEKLDIQMLMQVHDAIGGQFPKAHLDAALEHIAQCMLIPITNPRTYEDFYIPVEMAYGENWANVNKVRSVYGPAATTNTM